jgi:S-DNA-T family DNA segregation ATPase FtsK/SpoIIIE
MRTTTSLSALDRIPDPLRAFAARRCAELGGVALIAAVGGAALSLISWSVQDPSLNHATTGTVHNLLGRPGAMVADVLMQLLGIAAVVFLVPLALWGWTLLTQRRLDRLRLRLLLWTGGSAAACSFAALLPVSGRWPLPTGLGGVVGDALLALPERIVPDHGPAQILLGLPLAIVAILMLSGAARLRFAPATVYDDEDEDDELPLRAHASAEDDDAGEPGFALIALGASIHAALVVKSLIVRLVGRLIAARRARQPAQAAAPWQMPWRDDDGLLEGAAGFEGRREPELGSPPFDATAYAPPAARAAARSPVAPEAEPAPQTRITPPAAAARPGARAAREASERPSRSAYQLPPLAMLAEAKKAGTTRISEDALQQNARLLEGVLEDFGVKGEIINVRPGPVVTLYELEPAPGIKSSRVIGLADDIARSMSAISARVAVVQGRNAIGIELPNQRRETVFLRELLAAEDFEETKHKLAIALGKTIGGEPIIVDLAKMPHLLVAGTTGSGKSVAINTMILSLLYRLKPSECRLIMVDPKMLELSVYDGIPHLLTPVVTDPKKAVVALKWAVREMEDRYKKMSKLGVRNIDGFNARVAEAAAKGETITRTVQTGYDRETGEAIYEREAMDLSVLPYIVVIVDEMADLMMVAGKDIEGAIQRLAQMARAAGIHLIMATQRPSVDVITGTIKANFPTRISFQVTSKIDSRTILGEQGAEQLLGQGDMLYMAGGGRISRVHGPFVSDGDVEKIVAHLKAQGAPEYLDAITMEDEPEMDDDEAPAPGSMDAEESGDYYDRAVAIVLRDRKCSTSYIQRRLSVGYNKAASLVERMEKEGVVGAPNHAGKRTILVGGGIDRGAFDLRPDEE